MIFEVKSQIMIEIVGIFRARQCQGSGMRTRVAAMKAPTGNSRWDIMVVAERDDREAQRNSLGLNHAAHNYTGPLSSEAVHKEEFAVTLKPTSIVTQPNTVPAYK